MLWIWRPKLNCQRGGQTELKGRQTKSFDSYEYGFGHRALYEELQRVHRGHVGVAQLGQLLRLPILAKPQQVRRAGDGGETTLLGPAQNNLQIEIGTVTKSMKY